MYVINFAHNIRTIEKLQIFTKVVNALFEEARRRQAPTLRQQFEEHDAKRDVDEEHQDYQLLSREPVLK